MEEFQTQCKVVLQQMKSDCKKNKEHDDKIMVNICYYSFKIGIVEGFLMNANDFKITLLNRNTIQCSNNQDMTIRVYTFYD